MSQDQLTRPEGLANPVRTTSGQTPNPTPHPLRGRSFLKELDFTPDEWRSLLDLSAALKEAKRTGTEVPHLAGRNIALIFEKTSTRTRCSFEVAAFDQGAHVTYLEPSGLAQCSRMVSWSASIWVGCHSSVRPFHTGTPDFAARTSTAAWLLPRYSMPS